MVDTLGGEFDRFQLNARTVTFKGADLKTRAWVLEMDREDAKVWMKPLHKAFPFRKNETTIQLSHFRPLTHGFQPNSMKPRLPKSLFLPSHQSELIVLSSPKM